MLITALATPLHEDYSLDIKSFHRLLQHQKRGADGVIIAGTTGQGSLLSDQEKSLLLQASQDFFHSHPCPVMTPSVCPSDPANFARAQLFLH